jgi:hypothetical protein
MGISWVLILSDSDGALQKFQVAGNRSAVQVWLDAGVIPVLRFAPSDLPRPFPHMDHVDEFVRQCEPYGVPAIVQWPNEAGNYREWRRQIVPDNWFEIFMGLWNDFVNNIIIPRGAIAGFPDGPSFDVDPFPYMESTWQHWEDGKCIYLGHFYAHNRPPDYPYDNIQRWGEQWTEAQLKAYMGDFYDNPDYNDIPLDVMNRARVERKDPDLTAVDDDVCWRGFERVDSWMHKHFGRTLAMALTEGGWTPGARAGGNGTSEIRYPKTTPDNVASFTLQAMETETPMIFQAPWLLADGSMACADQGWPYDAWFGWAFMDMYGLAKPVIRVLQENPPGGGEDKIKPLLESASGLIDEAIDVLGEAASLP